MRSLSQLNTRGQTSLPYTDNRPAGVIYDRANPTNMTAEVVTASSFSLIPGIEVLDISQPDALNFVYVIDISQIYPASFAIAAYTVGTTMYVLNSAGVIKAGATVTGTGGESNQIAANTTVVNQVTPLISGETLGGVGRYTISVSQDIEDADILAASITDTGTVTVINSYSGTDTFECNTICFLTPNMPIQFIGSVFGGISTGVTYYVKTVSSTEFSISNTPGGAVVQLTESSGSMIASGSFGALCLVVTSSGGGITPGSYLGASGLPAGVQIVAQIGGGSISAGTYSLSGPAVALGSRQMYTAFNFSNTNPRGSVTWATTPAGVTVSQTLGVYTVSLDTAAQWAVMRNPTVTLPANWADDFTISSYVDTDIAASKNWTTTVDVTFGANITSTATIFARLTGTQNFNAAISSLAAQAVSYRRYRATGASITASASISPSGGKRVEVSAAISSISTLITSATVNCFGAAAISAVSTLNAPRLGMMKGQAAITSTASMVTNARIIKDNTIALNSAFTTTPTANDIIMTVTVGADSVSNIYNNWYYGLWNGRTFAGTRQAFPVTGPSAGIRILSRSSVTETDLVGDRWNDAEEYIGVNSDFSRAAFAISSNINVHGVAQSDLYIYSRSGSTWTRDVKFDSIPSYSSRVTMSKDGNYVALFVYDDVVAPMYNSVKIYQYSGGSWSLLYTLTLSSVGAISGLAFNNDGTYFAVNFLTGNSEIYVKSGSTWVLQQTLSGITGIQNITLTDAGDYAVIGCDSQSPLTFGAIKVFKRTGSSWALEQTLNYESPATGNFGDWVTTDGTITNIQTSSLTRLVTFTRI